MDYQSAVDTVIRPRSLAFLERLRDTLVPLGVSLSDVSVGEVDAIDLRFELTALGTLGRRFTCAIELTDTLRIGGETNGIGVLMLQASDVLAVLALSSYNAGDPVRYDSESGVAELVAKMDDIDAAEPEVIAKARIALGL